MRDDIHVVLDSVSVANETPLANDPRVHIIPLIVQHGNLEWRDGEKSLSEMFDIVKATGVLPKTSQPPIGEFVDMFTELVKAGKKVIGIFVDGVLSGTVETARTAAKQVLKDVPGSDIRIFDARTAACPISGMAIAAIRKIDEGWEMDQLEPYIDSVIHRTETYFTVSTLDYLQKGGRIGAVGALVGNILGIKPIVHLNKKGELLVWDKCRARKKTLAKMVEYASGHGDVEAIFVAHAADPEDVNYLETEMAKRFPGVEILTAGIGTTLAAHLGPGCIGVFVRTKEEGGC